MDVALLPVKPGTLTAKDRATLSKAGVIVIEHDEPHTLRLLTPIAELGTSDLFACAIKALADPNCASASVQAAFTRAVAGMVADKRK